MSETCCWLSNRYLHQLNATKTNEMMQLHLAGLTRTVRTILSKVTRLWSFTSSRYVVINHTHRTLVPGSQMSTWKQLETFRASDDLFLANNKPILHLVVEGAEASIFRNFKHHFTWRGLQKVCWNFWINRKFDFWVLILLASNDWIIILYFEKILN